MRSGLGLRAFRLRARTAGAGAGLAILLTAGGAHASPIFELVGSGQGTGGFSARATSPSAASAYFNPALLPYAKQGVEVGVFFLSSQIGIEVDGRELSSACGPGGACDVPSVRGAAPESYRHADGSPIGNPPLPTQWLEQGHVPSGIRAEDGLPARPRQGDGSGHAVLPYQMIGLVAPVFGERLTLGLHAMIPLREFTTARSFYGDEREQFFSNSLHPELYGDRLTATSLAFGGGSRIGKKLSLGMAFTLSLTNKAIAPVYVSNLSNLNTLLIDSRIGVETAVAPHFGVVYDPTPDLRLVMTLHTPRAFEIQSGFEYTLATGAKQGAAVSFTHDYMPLTLALGGTYALGALRGHHVSATATAYYARWSDYKDRHSERPVSDYSWSDLVYGTFGMRDAVGELETFFDVTYQPSPVPLQTGRSNYVDNERVATCFGAEYKFPLWGSHIRAGAQAQVHWLPRRHQNKIVAPPGNYPQLVKDEVPDDAVDSLGDPVPGRAGLQTNNPGFPGFASEGWLVGGSLYVAILY